MIRVIGNPKRDWVIRTSESETLLTVQVDDASDSEFFLRLEMPLLFAWHRIEDEKPVVRSRVLTKLVTGQFALGLVFEDGIWLEDSKIRTRIAITHWCYIKEPI